MPSIPKINTSAPVGPQPSQSSHHDLSTLYDCDDDTRLKASVAFSPRMNSPSSTEIVAMEKQSGKSILFSKEVFKEVASLPDQSAEFAKRPRVQGTTLTIDAYTTKDMDDGLSFRREEDGTLVVGVHITDVSAWIRPGGPTNFSARLRVESRYTNNNQMVIPMLPRPLSDELLSLNHAVPRLTKSVEMHFSPEGKLLDHKIFRSVFVSQHRLDKTDANKAKNGEGAGATDPKLADALQMMEHVASKLPGKALLDSLIMQSCKLVAHDLKEAGLETSFRNQHKPNEKSSYGAEALGHAGLKTDAYVQWTSPIRRYSDLDVHRSMDRMLDGKTPTGRLEKVDHEMREVELNRANNGADKRMNTFSLLRRELANRNK